MNAKPGQRSTFLELDDILARTRRYAERARDRLAERMREGDPDERVRLFLDRVEGLRRDLEEAMEGARRDAPERVLTTRAQYTVDPWEDEPDPPRCASVEEAVAWMIDLDRRLVDTYRELAERTESEAVADFCGNLVELIRAHDQNLSKAARDAHDV